MLQVINMGKMFDTHIIIVLINEGVCFYLVDTADRTL